MSFYRPRRRLQVGLVIGVGTICAVLIGVGVFGLVHGPNAAHSVRVPAAPTPPLVGGHGEPAIRPRALPVTADPEVFASGVAHALFTWDTSTGLDLSGYEQPLIAAADSSGTDAPGLIHDLTNYFPSPQSWLALRDYATRQSITISRLYLPRQWRQTVAARNGRIQHGVVGYSVEGTRHRAGWWLGRPVTSTHPVSFTVFLACPPATATCSLLRLSRLNDPLH